MKRLFSLLSLCLILIVGCEKENESETRLPKRNVGESLDYKYLKGYYLIDNIDQINSEHIWGEVGKDTTWVSGFKNDKRWICMLDESSKKILKEWQGVQILENSELTRLILSPEHIVSINSGFVFVSNLGYIDGGLAGYSFFHLTKDEVIVEKLLEGNYHSLNVINCNDDKVLITDGLGYFRYMILSLEGDILVTDITIDTETIEENILLTGFDKTNKVWIGLYSKLSDDHFSLKEEWIGIEEFQRNKRIFQNTNIIQYYIEAIGYNRLIKTSWGYVFSPYYINQNYANQRINTYDLFLLNSDKKNIYYYANNTNTGKSFRIWYNDYILADGRIILSPTGKIYAKLNETCSETDIPVSYTETVKLHVGTSGGNARRYDHLLQRTIWHKEFKLPVEVEFNAEILTTLVKQNETSLEYNCEIIHFDDTKQQFKITINTETGEVAF